jgi:hypothetical protein
MTFAATSAAPGRQSLAGTRRAGIVSHDDHDNPDSQLRSRPHPHPALAKVELARLRNIVRRIRDGGAARRSSTRSVALSRMVVPTAAQESRSP